VRKVPKIVRQVSHGLKVGYTGTVKAVRRMSLRAKTATLMGIGAGLAQGFLFADAAQGPMTIEQKVLVAGGIFIVGTGVGLATHWGLGKLGEKLKKK
jgi:hypothetical protein